MAERLRKGEADILELHQDDGGFELGWNGPWLHLEPGMADCPALDDGFRSGRKAVEAQRIRLQHPSLPVQGIMAPFVSHQAEKEGGAVRLGMAHQAGPGRLGLRAHARENEQEQYD